MKTLNRKNTKLEPRSNTKYKGITYTFNGNVRCYMATNKYTGDRKKFYINRQHSREQAFMRAMAYVNS